MSTDKTKHTPGPLKVLQNNKDDTRATQFLVVREGGEKLVALAKVANSADADLYAAAPDLLAALKWLLDVTDHGTNTDPIFGARKVAYAAIAKAEGRE